MGKEQQISKDIQKDALKFANIPEEGPNEINSDKYEGYIQGRLDERVNLENAKAAAMKKGAEDALQNNSLQWTDEDMINAFKVNADSWVSNNAEEWLKQYKKNKNV